MFLVFTSAASMIFPTSVSAIICVQFTLLSEFAHVLKFTLFNFFFVPGKGSTMLGSAFHM